jgi:hypothetical protein
MSLKMKVNSPYLFVNVKPLKPVDTYTTYTENVSMAQRIVDSELCNGASGMCLSLSTHARASWRHGHQQPNTEGLVFT